MSFQKEPLISVIINCYNGEKFLEENLISIKKQTYKNIEVIFWDNHSTDNSAKIFKSIKDERFFYFLAEKHTNLSSARNLSIEKSKGELISFIDCDDTWEETKLAEQSKLLINNDEVGAVYTGYNILNHRKKNFFIEKVNRNFPSGFITNYLLKDYCIGFSSVIFKKKYLTKFNPKYHMIYDFDTILNLSLYYKILCVNKPLTNFRIHSQNERLLNRQSELNEKILWVEEDKNQKNFSKYNNFRLLKIEFYYAFCLSLLLQNKKNKDFFLFYKKIPFSVKKIKLTFIRLMPLKLIQLIKKYY